MWNQCVAYDKVRDNVRRSTLGNQAPRLQLQRGIGIVLPADRPYVDHCTQPDTIDLVQVVQELLHERIQILQDEISMYQHTSAAIQFKLTGEGQQNGTAAALHSENKFTKNINVTKESNSQPSRTDFLDLSGNPSKGPYFHMHPCPVMLA